MQREVTAKNSPDEFCSHPATWLAGQVKLPGPPAQYSPARLLLAEAIEKAFVRFSRARRLPSPREFRQAAMLMQRALQVFF
jgi:hypothetical protein